MKININKINKIFAVCAITALILKSCLHADVPLRAKKELALQKTASLSLAYPGEFKTVELNGIEYRQARGEVGKYGGTLSFSRMGEGPKTMNPWFASDSLSSIATSVMYDGLVSMDVYSGRPVPLLAKSVAVDKTGCIYDVTLRKGLKWSDGKPITADDVVFTWRDIILAGFGNTSMLDNIRVDGKIPSVKKTGNLKVRFITPKPFAPFMLSLSQPIAPKHVFAPVVKKGKEAFNSFYGVNTPAENFVSSGAFKLLRYVPAQRIEYIRNPNYYAIDKKNNRLPYLDKYLLYFLGDINNQSLKFEAGQLDVLQIYGSDAARFKYNEKRFGYTMYNLGADTGTVFLTFNLNNRKNKQGRFFVDPIKQNWFSDKNFRRAVNLTIDRESIVANVLRGAGQPLYTAESLTSIFLNKKLKNGEQRNVEEAKRLLKLSGFYTDSSGKLFDQKGNRVEFTLNTNAGNTQREAIGVIIKEDLEELGMKVNFKPIEFNTLIGRLSATFDWEALIMGLTGSPIDPNSGRNVWNSTGTIHMFNQRSGDDLKNPKDLLSWEKELDQLFEEGARTLDFEKRRKVYEQYQQVVYDYNPFIYLYSQLNIFAVRNRFGNVNPTPLGEVLHNLDEIYVK